ncbi:4'-phosphopantetheinyl transferase superfamily protein [Kitasatospora sp. RG8]|uniref:4'-phosphopantetheinyl transferase superfamily protein n=1 Tax=Kitasatospora sp. RG8 TaxID=2820815 RepID=UPI001ADF9C21|nr:4'-phosphopantetheinyl transferase superfamily protein [Kitasatospora sp. RG8]MBP0450772.1 4'-phosphopantetheinyl transferase superfamily protein [Kitasatospora sp. RG8]
MTAELTRRQVLDDLPPLRAALAARGLSLAWAVAEADADGDAGHPDVTPAGPGEAQAAAGMPPTRRREFLAGRWAARRALRAAGGPGGEIGRAGRRPLAPAGWALSISHSAGLAVAVAAPLSRYAAVGCDLELRRLPAAAARLVLTGPERAWAGDAGTPGAEHRLLALFSAKEAAFKLLCGLRPETFGALTVARLSADPPPVGARPRAFRLRPSLPGAPDPQGVPDLPCPPGTARAPGTPPPAALVRVGATGDGVFCWTALPASVRR